MELSLLNPLLDDLHEKLFRAPVVSRDYRTNLRHGDEIDGDQLLGMILKECRPALRGRFVTSQHVFADTALSDVDAEFEEFAMDAGCTPSGILPAHLADQISVFARNDRSSRLAAPSKSRTVESRHDARPGPFLV